MIERISQTFMKDMREYLAGQECGNIIRHKFIDLLPFNRSSIWMDQGNYFEFLLTGTVPKNRIIPKPVYMDGSLKKKPAEKLTVEDMVEGYRRVHANVAQVRRYFVEWGLEIVAAGKQIVKGRFEGTIDLIVKCTKEIHFRNGIVWMPGDLLCFDCKYSGLMDNKWEKLGWTWSDIQRKYNRPQAANYHFLTGIPFYFLVTQSNNREVEDEKGKKTFAPADVQLFPVSLSTDTMDAHIREGNKLLEELAMSDITGFIPRPSLLKCSKCPIKANCKDRMDWPEPRTIEL